MEDAYNWVRRVRSSTHPRLVKTAHTMLSGNDYLRVYQVHDGIAVVAPALRFMVRCKRADDLQHIALACDKECASRGSIHRCRA